MTRDVDNFPARVKVLFGERYDTLARKTDRLFAYLFGFQWAAAILFAVFLAPQTWSGGESQIHIHLYAAVFLGGLVALLPIALIYRAPGTALNRMVVAVSQMLFSVLFIHLTAGRIETHFHIFGSLAFLAFYRDWRAVALGSAVTLADHLIRGAFWPQSVYGVLYAPAWRAFEHAAWVLFEDLILFYSIRIALGELRDVSESQVKLQDNFGTIEEQVRRRTEELRESHRRIIEQEQSLSASAKMSALGEMAGGVAHEINNPLATIKILSSRMHELLDDPNVDKKMIQEMVGMIETTTDRIARIVQGLRSFSRDGSGDPYDTVNVASLIEDTLSFCKARFKDSGVALMVEPFPSGLSFEGRSTQISQVLLNLLNNAYDAIHDRNERWVHISARVDRDILELRVTDSGQGIPPSIAEKIFQPFFTTKEIGKGTGMGLSISSGIVKSHRGELSVDRACANTCFVMRLPLRQSAKLSVAA